MQEHLITLLWDRDLAREIFNAAPIFLFFFFFFGSCVGSFINVCLYRLPKRVSLLYPPSSCPACEQRIPWYDNLPVLGWLLLKGNCRSCGLSIHPGYPLLEFVFGLFSVGIFYDSAMQRGDLQEWAYRFAMVSLFYSIAHIDMRHRLIPDPLTIIPILSLFVWTLFYPSFNYDELPSNRYQLLVFGLFLPWFLIWGLVSLARVFLGEGGESRVERAFVRLKLLKDENLSSSTLGMVILALLSAGGLYFLVPEDAVLDLNRHAAGAALAGGLMWTLRGLSGKLAGKETLGMGDIKLCVLLGWLFPISFMAILFLGSFTGILVSLLAKAVGWKWTGDGEEEDAAIPLGPFLVIYAMFFEFFPLEEILLRVVELSLAKGSSA